MLMILSNCDDGGMRNKAVKVIGDIVNESEYIYKNKNNSILKNIHKCLTNRLADTDIKTRQLSLNTYITILPYLNISI